MEAMQFKLSGINRKTTPLDILEKAAISTSKLAESLTSLRPYTPNGIILSTCNRTEIYTVINDNKNSFNEGILDFFGDIFHIPRNDLHKYLYEMKDVEAFTHIFRVASGLESMIIGEFEILGQIKQAFEASERVDMVNPLLRQVFNSALRTGRIVREKTEISRNALSISSVAVELATRIIGDLKQCRMLVIGAGDAGRLVARAAKERGTCQIAITGRTRERVQALVSALGGTPVDASDLDTELKSTDLVVSCAGAPHRILRFQKVEEVLRSRTERPLVIIDIAIPRNVEPEVGNIPGVFLYNIDNLNGIAEMNRKQRQSEIQKAEQIITQEVKKFDLYWHNLKTRPVVGLLMSHAEEIRSAQLKKTLKKLPRLSDEQSESLEAMTKSIVNQVLRYPIRYLKTSGDRETIELVKELFNLETGKSQR